MPPEPPLVAGAPEPSHVLRAMGRSPEEARSGLRLSVGPETTAAEIAYAVEVIARTVAEVRARVAA